MNTKDIYIPHSDADKFQGLSYYLPTFIILAPVYGRFHIFTFFNGCLLLSTIKGWMIKKPNLVLDHKMTQDEWSLMKNELKEWITFYLDLSVS